MKVIGKNINGEEVEIKINNKYVLKGKSLIKTETILFNGFDRISNRNYNYFNHVQAYHLKYNT